jgi:hypothetical protein
MVPQQPAPSNPLSGSFRYVQYESDKRLGHTRLQPVSQILHRSSFYQTTSTVRNYALSSDPFASAHPTPPRSGTLPHPSKSCELYRGFAEKLSASPSVSCDTVNVGLYLACCEDRVLQSSLNRAAKVESMEYVHSGCVGMVRMWGTYRKRLMKVIK